MYLGDAIGKEEVKRELLQAYFKADSLMDGKNKIIYAGTEYENDGFIMSNIALLYAAAYKGTNKSDFADWRNILAKKLNVEKFQSERDRREQAEKDTFHRDIFPVLSCNPKLASVWNDACCHDDNEQILRQKQALCRTIPILVDINNFEGEFVSFGHWSSDKREIYKTTLMTCDCADYKTRRLPCMHMYRLFYEIEKYGKNSPLVPKYEILSAYQKLNTRDKLYFITEMVSFNVNREREVLRKDVAGLLKSKLAIEVGEIDYFKRLNKITKVQLIINLRNRGITGYRESWAKTKLIDWILAQQKEYLNKEYKGFARITISPAAIPWAAGIHEYLQKPCRSSQQYEGGN
jgi:hypothetical protein